tara:strand:- start:2978 stop:3427 length:450 start_codon:yes stop_codon:yes gene_type:complete
MSISKPQLKHLIWEQLSIVVGEKDKKDFKCPESTQDITVNLENRNKAIKDQNYGPPDPSKPNEKFWAAKMEMWNVDSKEELKGMICGTCAAFNLTEEMQACIAKGIGEEPTADPWATIEAGEVGYCQFLKFKCAANRTCDAWVSGGPIK